MELRDLIERGIDEAGGTSKLAALLDLRPNQVTDAKAHRNGIPVASCFQLAELLHEDARCVIAASELVTEKKPERRAVLAPFASHATIIAIAAAVVLYLTGDHENAMYSIAWIGAIGSNTNYGGFALMTLVMLLAFFPFQTTPRTARGRGVIATP